MGTLNETNIKILLGTLPVIVTILIAITGYIFTYLHNKRITERNARFERINNQLRNLYGPLYAELTSGQVMWQAFVQKHWPKHNQNAFFNDTHQTTDSEKAIWRHWMRVVFQPHNEHIEKIILENADLLQGDDFPASFIDLISHVGTYKAVIKKWEEGDFSEHTSICNFPGKELMENVEPIYKDLRKKQKELLGLLKR